MGVVKTVIFGGAMAIGMFVLGSIGFSAGLGVVGALAWPTAHYYLSFAPLAGIALATFGFMKYVS